MKYGFLALVTVLSLTACKVENTRIERDKEAAAQRTENQADRMENQADQLRDQAQDIRKNNNQ